MKNPTKNQPSWYGRVWEMLDSIDSNLKSIPCLDVENYPEWQRNVVQQLLRQFFPLTPPTELLVITPETLGLLLGQRCSHLYALGAWLASASKVPDAAKRGKALKRKMVEQSHVPGMASALQAMETLALVLKDFAKDSSRFEELVQQAFKAALGQPNYQEAVEFFRGFATGLATHILKDGGLVRKTDATELHMKMFIHAEQAKKFRTVTELRAFLLKSGFTQETLGDDERLQKYCNRIKYAPGKRGRPPKQNK